MGPVTVTAGAAIVATTGAVVASVVTNGDSPPRRALEAATDAMRAVRDSGAPTVRGGNGYVPDADILAQWERKMGRPSSARSGIRYVPRVHTYPYLRSNPHILTSFATLASEALGITEKGGILWAVKANIEGGYLQNGSWNRNTGNVKLYSGLARQAVTPQCWFLVDGVNSLDAYQSFGVEAGELTPQYLEDKRDAWIAAVRDAFARTFGQTHYQRSAAVVGTRRLTFMECLNEGYLQQVCAIMGGNGYAMGYRGGTFMTARYRRMYTSGYRGRPMIPRDSLRIHPVTRVIPRTREHPFTEVF